MILSLFSRLWNRFEAKQGKEKWVRTIYRDGRPLIVRYYICSTRWIDDSSFFKRHPVLQRALRWASFRVVVHQMYESDADGLHDHPWPWGSMILAGGYFEHTPEGVFWRWPGHLRFRPASAFHRLVLDPNNRKEVWTVFLMGWRLKEWGFLDGRNQNWTPWYKHSGLTPNQDCVK